MMKTTNRRPGFFLSILAIHLAVLAGFATSAVSQSVELEVGRIAPRHLNPRLQREGKISRQKQGTEAPTEAAPFGLESPRSPATDNLVITKGFAGIAFPNSFSSVPPDTIAAVGPAHIVEVTNTTIAFYSRVAGKRLFIQDLALFFAPTGTVTFGFDPVVTYDELAERFVVAMIDEDDSLVKGYLLYAVSNSSNPLDGFSEMHRVDVTEHGIALNETVLPDFTRIGWNADAHVITFNMFGAISQNFDHVTVITINKNTVLDENSATFAMTHTNRNNTHFTLMPAVMHGSITGDPMWFVEETVAIGGSEVGTKIRVVKMTNVLGAAPIFSDTDLTVNAYTVPPDADQPGSVAFGLIQTNDSSIISAAWRGNRLLAAHNIGLTSTSQAHVGWYEFNTSGPSPTLTQQGTINPGPGINTYYPSVEIAPNGDIGMTFMQSSTSQFMSMYVTGQNSADPPGEMRGAILAKAGLRTYSAFDCADRLGFFTDCRGGDFSGISVDPNFLNMFCAANEYATSSKSNNWGTWIACFAIGVRDLAVTRITPPATVSGSGPITGSVKVVIQNRGDHTETVMSGDLGNGVTTGLVRLAVNGVGCQPAVVALDTAKNAASFKNGAQNFSPKKSLTIYYLVTFQCSGAGGTYSFSATAHHEVLDGSPDTLPQDSICPRDAFPGLVDPLPYPKGTPDKGCGAKKPDGTLGNPVVTNVVS